MAAKYRQGWNFKKLGHPIPIEVLKPLIRESVSKREMGEVIQETGVNGQTYSAYDAFAGDCGITPAVLWNVMKAENVGNISFSLADKIVTKGLKGGAGLWHTHPELSKWYWPPGEEPPDKMKPFKCANTWCEEWFTMEPQATTGRQPTKQRFCTRRCRDRLSKYIHDYDGTRPPDRWEETRICPWCKQEFKTRWRGGRKEYCSHSHSVMYTQRIRRARQAKG